jgi:hypothetical protein
MPCSGWNLDVSGSGCCDSWGDYSENLQQAAMEYGAFTIWAATGRRFGLCPQTIRPCGRYCGNSQNAGYWWSEGTWMPYIFNGEWRNCWGGCGDCPGCCSCDPACQVWLPTPVYSVSEVTIDGDVVDPNTYRVDNGRWLVRTHNESEDDCWPQCQNFNINEGTDTFYVTFLKGKPVPSVLLRAASELACEWAKACVGAECRLPGRVTNVARQGVSISMVSLDELLRNGLTGVTTVDQIIRSFNPYGLNARMRIDSPDLPGHRTQTWP